MTFPGQFFAPWAAVGFRNVGVRVFGVFVFAGTALPAGSDLFQPVRQDLVAVLRQPVRFVVLLRIPTYVD